MVISNVIRTIVDRMKLNEMVHAFSSSPDLSVITRNTAPTYNLLKDVLLIDNGLIKKSQLKAISFRALELSKPTGWTAIDFQIIGTAPYFFNGHPLDIISQLKTISQSPNAEQKYPFIAMLHDFEESENNGLVTATIEFIIGTCTEAKYTAPEREKINFIPILIPLVDEFKRQLRGGSNYLLSNQYEFTETKNMFLGKKGLYGVEGNIFNDKIDAITLKAELRFLNNC